MLHTNESTKKPIDWPINEKEIHLSNIYQSIIQFKNVPNYKTKDNIISLISKYNPHKKVQHNRFTVYEAKLIKKIYLNSLMIAYFPMLSHLLIIMANDIKTNNITVDDLKQSKDLINYTNNLSPVFIFFYYAYSKFISRKNVRFPSILFQTISKSFRTVKDPDTRFEISSSFVSLINAISNIREYNGEEIFLLSRKEIKKTFKLISILLDMTNQDPSKRPLKGLLLISIQNFILKSRNNYSNSYYLKYISKDNLNKALKNNQLWMNRIEYLNDSRESKVAEELFKNLNWIKYNWVKKPNLTPSRNYFVTCFSRGPVNKSMQKIYGNCVLGYYSDKITDLISPVISNNHQFPNPNFGQVNSFDVIYDVHTAKKEINFLIDIINLFHVNDDKKNKILQDILQYWILSFKDKKWEYEKERRYVIVTNDDYDYDGIDLSNKNLFKLKTSLLYSPDFILDDE